MMIPRSSPRTERGFSLVELMVGMVVALLTTIVIFRSFQAYEGQRRTTGASSDAIANGQYVTSFLGREFGQAGWGFQLGSGGVGCDFSGGITAAAWRNFTLRDAGGGVLTTPTGIDQRTMVPVMIVDGGSASGRQTGSDAIRVMYSNSVSSVAINGTVANTTTFLPTSTVTFQQGDMVLMQNTATRACQLGQITNTNPNTTTGVQMVAGTGPCVAGSTNCGGSAFNAASTLAGSGWIANLGSALTVNTYVVQGNTLWQYSGILGNSYNATNTPLTGPITGTGYVRDTSGIGLQTAVSQDIVNIQAEYGLDTQGSGTTGQGVSDVDTWQAATGNYTPANLNGATAGNHNFAQQIRAIRYLVVTRSALPEKRDGSGNCVATPAANRYKTLTWPNGGNIQIDLSTNEPATNTWGCYRYQFFMDTVPLRSLIWSVRGYE